MKWQKVREKATFGPDDDSAHVPSIYVEAWVCADPTCKSVRADKG